MATAPAGIPPDRLAAWDQARAEGEVGLGKLLQLVRIRLDEGETDLVLIASIMTLCQRSKPMDVSAMLGLALLRLAKRDTKAGA